MQVMSTQYEDLKHVDEKDETYESSVNDETNEEREWLKVTSLCSGNNYKQN